MNPTDDPRGPVPDADPLDELASAVLDGEATPGAPDLGGDALVARVAAFQRVARVIGAPVEAVDDDRREAAIATALAAWGTTAPSDDPAIVTDLATVRSRRQSTGLWVAGIAAVAAVVVAFGGLALRSDGNNSADTAASASSEETETFGDDALATESGGGDSAGGDGAATQDRDQSAVPSTAADAPASAEAGALTVDLGDFEQLVDLFAAALARLQPAARFDAAFSDAGCAAAEPDGITAAATARLDGEPVVVALVEDGDERVVQVYDATCRLMAERPAS